MIERFNAVSPALKGNVPLKMPNRSINYQICYPSIIRELAGFCKKIVNNAHNRIPFRSDCTASIFLVLLFNKVNCLLIYCGSFRGRRTELDRGSVHPIRLTYPEGEMSRLHRFLHDG